MIADETRVARPLAETRPLAYPRGVCVEIDNRRWLGAGSANHPIETPTLAPITSNCHNIIDVAMMDTLAGSSIRPFSTNSSLLRFFRSHDFSAKSFRPGKFSKLKNSFIYIYIWNLEFVLQNFERIISRDWSVRVENYFQKVEESSPSWKFLFGTSLRRARWNFENFQTWKIPFDETLITYFLIPLKTLVETFLSNERRSDSCFGKFKQTSSYICMRE